MICLWPCLHAWMAFLPLPPALAVDSDDRPDRMRGTRTCRGRKTRSSLLTSETRPSGPSWRPVPQSSGVRAWPCPDNLGGLGRGPCPCLVSAPAEGEISRAAPAAQRRGPVGTSGPSEAPWQHRAGFCSQVPAGTRQATAGRAAEPRTNPVLTRELESEPCAHSPPSPLTGRQWPGHLWGLLHPRPWAAGDLVLRVLIAQRQWQRSLARRCTQTGACRSLVNCEVPVGTGERGSARPTAPRVAGRTATWSGARPLWVWPRPQDPQDHTLASGAQLGLLTGLPALTFKRPQ